MSVTVEAIEKRDGRRERAVASRARILEAMVDLIQAGEVQPSAEAVAVRAGVGVRTVFRLFNDVEGLHRGLQQVMDERLAPIYDEPVRGTLAERLDQLVARRAVVFEKLARPKAFADANRSLLIAGLEAGRFVSLPAQEGVIYVGEMSADGAHFTLSIDLLAEVIGGAIGFVGTFIVGRIAKRRGGAT